MKQSMFIAKAAVICWLGISVMVFSYVEIDDCVSQDLGYENTIVAIQEFTTLGGCKLILTFQHDDPVCVYAPQSFSESLDNTSFRIYMPRTMVADGVSSSYDIQQSDDGIELLLTGKSLKKIMSGNVALFILEK